MKVINTPKSLELSLTTKCNLRCTYCSHFTSASDVAEDLPAEEWLLFFQELSRCAVMSVTLEGGEIFCRPDIKMLIEGIIVNRMRFSILTNGTLINEEIAQFLASTKRCESVQVSLDGSNAFIHDATRGKGNYLRAIAGLKILRQYTIPLTVRVTINRFNVNDLENIARLLLEEIGLDHFSTNSASYQGLCRKNAEEVQLTVKERSFAMAELLRLHKKYNGRINAAAGPLAEAMSWVQISRLRAQGIKAMPNKGWLTACGGGMTKMAVRADGVMVPCTLLSHIELGRINRDSLRGVWQGHPELLRLRSRPRVPLTEFEYCKGCEFVNYCSGNCPALAYTLVGDAYHPSPDACLKLFLEKGGILPAIELGEKQ